jgi:transposase
MEIPWQNCPRERFGPSSTLYYYFTQWSNTGVFGQLWAEALAVSDDLEGIDWTSRRRDRVLTRARGGSADKAPYHGAR